MAEDERLSASEITTALEGTGFEPGRNTVHRDFDTGDFLTAVRLLDSIAEEAEAMGHHPDVTLGYGHLGITLSSHDVGGVTARDARLARRIQTLAEAAGVA